MCKVFPKKLFRLASSDHYLNEHRSEIDDELYVLEGVLSTGRYKEAVYRNANNERVYIKLVDQKFSFMEHTFAWLKGKIITLIEKIGDESLLFTLDNGIKCRLYHNQEGSEDVHIEDICGDLNDLIGVPLLQVEEVTNHEDESPIFESSETWTFYKMSTVKGYVTIRWYGSSNGYYSEKVDFDVLDYSPNPSDYYHSDYYKKPVKTYPSQQN